MAAMAGESSAVPLDDGTAQVFLDVWQKATETSQEATRMKGVECIMLDKEDSFLVIDVQWHKSFLRALPCARPRARLIKLPQILVEAPHLETEEPPPRELDRMSSWLFLQRNRYHILCWLFKRCREGDGKIGRWFPRGSTTMLWRSCGQGKRWRKERLLASACLTFQRYGQIRFESN